MMALKLTTKPKKLRKKEKGASKKFKGTGLKIVDEDDFGLRQQGDSDSDGKEADELPQLAAVVDERPEEVKALENFRKENKWKTLTSNSDNVSPPPHRENSLTEIQRQRHDSDSDASPPRRKRHDSDESPPRRHDSDASPPRRKRHDSDASPPRRKRQDSDASPPRRKRHDSDASPPRRKRHDSDASPPRRKRHDSDASPPPPRKNRQKSEDSDQMSPPRRTRHDSDGNMSPPRRNRNDPDFPRRDSGRSNSRRSQHQSDRNSGTSKYRHSNAEEDQDLSPPRRKNHNSDRRDRSPQQSRNEDLSPPRKRHHEGSKRRRVAPEILEDEQNDNMGKTLAGKKAGLQRGHALKKEMDELRRKEDAEFELLDDSVTGRNAKTRVGAAKERALAEESARKQEEEKFAAERKKQYDKWGKGLKQVEDQAARVDSALHEIAKPMARSKDDQDLDDHLKSLDRDGDPMLKFMTKKKGKANNKPMYSGPPPPPNRFHIPPGYRWDGVDRSNGYEKQWFGRINSKKALQEESYKWSAEDL